jgi:orotidine-5'-phosphate decarboxylase
MNSTKTIINSHQKLLNSIANKNSLLCVGLDTDINKIPLQFFTKDFDGLLNFNKTIIEQTQEFTAAYKINFAFYEQYGSDGFDLIRKTLQLIPQNIFTIADAKRGDIGNTSAAYSTMVFGYFDFDSITINPYMGVDSIEPFLEDKTKFIFVLALTSNQGSFDFQRLISADKPVYQHIIQKLINTFTKENLGFVIGATHPQELNDLRQIIPNNVMLIPGVGTQGADIEQVIKANNNAPAVINVSRAIIYPTISDNNFANSVRQTALFYKNSFQM